MHLVHPLFAYFLDTAHLPHSVPQVSARAPLPHTAVIFVPTDSHQQDADQAHKPGRACFFGLVDLLLSHVNTDRPVGQRRRYRAILV